MEGLPTEFIKKMEKLLGEEAAEFLRSYDVPRSLGLRVNTLKTGIDEFLALSLFPLEPVPWAISGFYYPPEFRPGKHPFHAAGLYYLQEPSAMAVAEVLGIKKGERVLDLCAAPGGKATQAAAFLQGEGILVANEIHPGRARILSENIERMGVKNALVLNESPPRLAERLPSFFDKMIVDAPCSGEGMFRKDEQAREEWSVQSCTMCSRRQREILESAAVMLKAGGRMVYSTCTFAPEENEEVMAEFLNDHPEFELIHIQSRPGFSRAVPEWGKGREDMERAVRLWPHRVRGEGHFMALLEKSESAAPVKIALEPAMNLKELEAFRTFQKEHLKGIDPERLIRFGEELYAIPQDMVALRGLKVLRPGWHLGSLKKRRFEPGHALALALKKEEVLYTLSLPPDSGELLAYLKGETIETEAKKGWKLVLAGEHSIGWGKAVDGILKNHYPKGLRWL